MVSLPRKISNGTDNSPRSQSICHRCGQRGHQYQDCVFNVAASDLKIHGTQMQAATVSPHSMEKTAMGELDGQDRALEKPVHDKILPYRDCELRKSISTSAPYYSEHQSIRDYMQQDAPEKKTRLQKSKSQGRLQLHEKITTIARRSAELNATEPPEKRRKRSHGGHERDDRQDTNYTGISAAQAFKESTAQNGTLHEQNQTVGRLCETSPCRGTMTAESFLDEMVVPALDQRAPSGENRTGVTDLIYRGNQDGLYSPTESPQLGMNGRHRRLPASTGFAARSLTQRYHPKILELRKRRHEMSETVNPPQRRSNGLDMWPDF